MARPAHMKVRRKTHVGWRIPLLLGILVFGLVAWPGPAVCRDYRERSLIRRIDSLLSDMAGYESFASSDAIERLSLCSQGQALRTLLARLAEREERADGEWERIESRLDELWRGVGIGAADELEKYIRADTYEYGGAPGADNYARQAARALGAMGDTAVPVLSRILAAGDASAKRYAAEGLARTGSADALAPLVTAASDPEPQVQAAAAKALAGMGTSGAVAELERIVASGRPAAGWAAAELAVKGGSRKPMDYLASVLKDKDPMVRAAAASPLGRIGDKAALAALASMLHDADASVRKSAVIALRDVGTDQAALVAAAALHDSDEAVREEALATVRAMGRPEALREYFAQALRAPNSEDRRSAAQALGALKDPDAVVMLIGATADPIESVRVAAARALGDIGDDRATSDLILALDSTRGETDIAIIEALGRIGDPRAVIALCDILKREHELAENPGLEPAVLEALRRTKTELGRQTANEYLRKKEAGEVAR